MSSRICIPTPASTVIGVASTTGGTSNVISSSVFRVDPTITALIGTGANALASLVTASDVYPLNICVFLPNLTTPATYQLVSGSDAESDPFVIRPNDFNPSTNAKVWKQRM